jgi:hypothetical protein
MKEPKPEALVAAAAAEEVVAAIADDAVRVSLLRKRFLRALYDNGWLDLVGRHWVQIGSGGFEFAPLTFAQADHLLRDLEEIGRERCHPMRGCRVQLSLD